MNAFSCSFSHLFQVSKLNSARIELFSYSPHPMWMKTLYINSDHTHISWSLITPFPTSWFTTIACTFEQWLWVYSLSFDCVPYRVLVAVTGFENVLALLCTLLALEPQGTCTNAQYSVAEKSVQHCTTHTRQRKWAASGGIQTHNTNRCYQLSYWDNSAVYAKSHIQCKGREKCLPLNIHVYVLTDEAE